MLKDRHINIKNILELSGEEDLLTVFIAIVNNIKGSKLVEEVLKYLEDSNVRARGLTDINKVALVLLLEQYVNICGGLFITNNKLDTIVDDARREIYKIDAGSGLRIATRNEVKDGVKGLRADVKYLIGEEKYKLLNLLVWTISGRLRYYKRAGYDYNYNKQYGLIDSIH